MQHSNLTVNRNVAWVATNAVIRTIKNTSTPFVPCGTHFFKIK